MDLKSIFLKASSNFDIRTFAGKILQSAYTFKMGS